MPLVGQLTQASVERRPEGIGTHDGGRSGESTGHVQTLPR